MVNNSLRGFMKQFFLTVFFVFSIIFFGVNFQTYAASNGSESPSRNFSNSNGKQPVLIELYTSEGCPVCPPADRNLTFFDKEQPFAGADLIALALHVDYWDSRGTIDEFASPMFSRRQDIYRQVFGIGSIYTPQMIIDGQMQFAGTDLAKAQKAIVAIAKNEKGKVELATAEDDKGSIKLQVKISDLPKHDVSTVFLAVAEDNPASNKNPGGGASRPFTSVTRELKSLGFLTADNKNLETETFLQLQPNWKEENLKLVVFVQENGNRKILAVGKLNLKKENNQ